MTLKEIVEHQATMESLWILNPTITEAMLQSALRHLHAVIEKDYELANIYKDRYWNLEEKL